MNDDHQPTDRASCVLRQMQLSPVLLKLAEHRQFDDAFASLDPLLPNHDEFLRALLDVWHPVAVPLMETSAVDTRASRKSTIHLSAQAKNSASESTAPITNSS